MHTNTHMIVVIPYFSSTRTEIVSYHTSWTQIHFFLSPILPFLSGNMHVYVFLAALSRLEHELDFHGFCHNENYNIWITASRLLWFSQNGKPENFFVEWNREPIFSGITFSLHRIYKFWTKVYGKLSHDWLIWCNIGWSHLWFNSRNALSYGFLYGVWIDRPFPRS